MKANRTALGIGAVVLALFGATSGVAHAEPGTNADGTVAGVSGVADDEPCAHALIQDSNYRTLVDTAPGQRNGFLDFSPVWRIKAC